MILLYRLKVFNVSASSLFLVGDFIYSRILNMPCSAELHFSIARQRTSLVPGTQTVLRTAKQSCSECSPEVPKIPRQSTVRKTVNPDNLQSARLLIPDNVKVPKAVSPRQLQSARLIIPGNLQSTRLSFPGNFSIYSTLLYMTKPTKIKINLMRKH